jgi:glycosyltransferase involved in cell wall biosynthesis
VNTISVITPTYKREDLLARCVESVLAQEVDAHIEHIVVNDAGVPLKKAAWMDDPRARVVETCKTERSVARNTGAALSTGQWLYFLDDDDYPLPGAFAKWLTVAQANPDAVHLYGGYEIQNEDEKTADRIQPQHAGHLLPILFAGETIPLQASLIRRETFFQSGGFDPLFVPVEDVDLLQRVTRLGPSAVVLEMVARVRVNHVATTTTSHERSTALFRAIPERWTQDATTVPLLHRMLHGDSYWTGRCARIYLIAAVNLLKKRQPLLSTTRLLQAFQLSGAQLLAPAFWKGVRRR